MPTLFALRTETAKLIKYKDHDDWTEMFDLTKDPFEMKNLIHEPAARELHETGRRIRPQKEAVGFVVPAYPSSDAEAVPLEKTLDSAVLEYHFDKDEDDAVLDASGNGNTGRAKNAPLSEGPDGRKARRFEGHGCIYVPKSPSLNPARRNWTVEVIFKTDAHDGILVAHGGGMFGYCLALKGGKPVFTVVGQKQVTRVTAADTATGAWTTVRADITPKTLSLTVNGAPPVREPLKGKIAKEPSDGLQIGDDLNSVVLGKAAKPPAFKGLIESVRIYSGMEPQ